MSPQNHRFQRFCGNTQSLPAAAGHQQMAGRNGFRKGQPSDFLRLQRRRGKRFRQKRHAEILPHERENLVGCGNLNIRRKRDAVFGKQVVCEGIARRFVPQTDERIGRQIEEEQGRLPRPGKNYLFQAVAKELAEYLEKVRLGKD